MRRFDTHIRHLLLAALSLLAVGCSVQEMALIPVSVIEGRITNQCDSRNVQVRVSRVGTWSERVPVTAESVFTDVEGDFVLKTERLDGGFVVARGRDFDMGFAPIFIEEYGETVSVESWQPSTGPYLVCKTPGESLFMVFEEDFELDFGPVVRVDLVGPESTDLDEDAIPMHDDGSLVDIDPDTPGMQVSGDVAAGDGVWTIRVGSDRFPAGEQVYGFYINENLDLGFQRDPYEESSDDDRSVILVK